MANIEIKKLKHSEVEVACAIPAENFEPHRAKAVKNLAKNTEVHGFRKGHIPENLLVKRVGESAILEEMAELALAEHYPKIISDNKIDAIGKPEVTITKLANGNPLEFKIRVAVMPEIALPDYKDIAKKTLAKKEELVVSDKELEDVLAEIGKMRARVEKQTGETTTDGGAAGKADEKEVREIDDAFVKTLGNFANAADFKEKLKENILKEKEQKARDKKKAEILGDIITRSMIDLPRILVDGELDKMTAQFKGDVARAGGTFEEYLKHIKKTEEDVRKEWTPDAEKRAKSQLILNKIAAEENISAPKDEVEKQVTHLLEHYKDANPKRARIYVETVLANEKVFEFLEMQK